jgi:hypothetical protein
VIAVFISGEGRNELGSWFGLEMYQSDEFPGVIKSLLGRVRADGWKIIGACAWKEIRKMQVGLRGKADERNVLGAVLKAKEKGCQVIAFVRDRNDSIQREVDVEKGIERAIGIFPEGPKVIGGVAIKRLESWMAALCGRNGSETIERPEDILREMGIGNLDTQGMVDIVNNARMDEVPCDAKSLHVWLDRARNILLMPG